MVDEFSNFARMAEPHPAMNDANMVLAEAVILYSEAHKNIRFKFEKDEALPPLFCDRDQLKRVFINIIDNAVASIDGRGNIHASSRFNANENMAVFEIDDDGCGLPAAYKDRLFEPYFSTRKMGTGLGLAIVHQVVTGLEGRIRLEDNSPRGTRVIIEIPVRKLQEMPLREA
jgi:two-component system nitrogen regulation sensor histidine kinase NtrY